MSSEASTAFGPYNLVRKLGEGGMAVTFQAKETIAGIGGVRTVAVKQILPLFTGDSDFRRMFLDEARLSTQLNHQNVCKTYTAGEINGTLFMAMEFIDGADLHHIMLRSAGLRGGFPLPHALAICEKVLHGLHAAHELHGESGELLGLVHRDVSPQNVLLSRQGEVKVIDFGVAKARGNQAQTQAGMVKGKVLYFSPEQLNGQPLDRRSDLFAAGLMLYELVTGEHPLRGETDIETIFNYINKTIRPPHEVRPELPRDVSDVVMKALEKNREERFPSADAMARALGDALFEVYPSYQEYLLRDFAQWAIAPEGDASYTLPESRGVRGSSPGLQPNPPQPGGAPSLPPRSAPWAAPPITGSAPGTAPPPSGNWPIQPSAEPARPPSNPGFAPAPPPFAPPSNPSFAPPSNPNFAPPSNPGFAPQRSGPYPVGPPGAGPSYPPPRLPQEPPSNTGWYVAIGLLAFLAVGCVLAFLATVFGGG